MCRETPSATGGTRVSKGNGNDRAIYRDPARTGSYFGRVLDRLMHLRGSGAKSPHRHSITSQTADGVCLKRPPPARVLCPQATPALQMATLQAARPAALVPT